MAEGWGTAQGYVITDANGDKWITGPLGAGGFVNARTGESLPMTPEAGYDWSKMPGALEGRTTSAPLQMPYFQPNSDSLIDKFAQTAIPLGIAGLGAGAIGGGLGLFGGGVPGAAGAGGAITGGEGVGALIGGAGADTLPGWISGFDLAGGGALGAGEAATAAAAGAPWVSGYDLAGGGAIGSGGSTSFLGNILNNVFGGGTVGVGKGINWGDIAKTALQAGASLYSGSQQAKAANEAALQQRLGAQAGIDEQRRQFDVTQQNLQPWLRGGQQGLVGIMQMLGIPMNPVTGQQMPLQSPDAILRRDPEYQFQVGEGMRALERSAAATTGTLNPRAVKALEKYGQGLASNAYTNRYNRLAALSGLGQTTGQNLGTLGQANSTNIANLLGQQGTAASAGTIGAANARASGLEGAAGAVGQYGQNQQLADILRRFGYGGNNQVGGL